MMSTSLGWDVKPYLLAVCPFILMESKKKGSRYINFIGKHLDGLSEISFLGIRSLIYFYTFYVVNAMHTVWL